MKPFISRQIKSSRLSRAVLQQKLKNRGSKSLFIKHKGSYNLGEPSRTLRRRSQNVQTMENEADTGTIALLREHDLSLSSDVTDKKQTESRHTIKKTNIKTAPSPKMKTGIKIGEVIAKRNPKTKAQSLKESLKSSKNTPRKNVDTCKRKKKTSTSQKQHVDSTNESSSESHTDITIEQCLDIPFQHIVTHVCIVDEETVWIGQQASGSILKVKYNKTNQLTIIKELKFPEHSFYDLCFDPKNNELLYSDRTNYSVMSVSEDYEVRVFKCVKPMKPTCITISPDNCVLVGIVDEYDYRNSPSRSIVKFSRNGELCLRIESMDGDNQLFALPHRCCINPFNNDIIVVGFKGSCDGKIFIFNSSGKYLLANKYEDPNSRFIPFGLTGLPNGNILCFDRNNGDIHILDARGKLIRKIKHSSLGIKGKPWSMSVGSHSHMIIGTWENPYGKVYISKYREGI